MGAANNWSGGHHLVIASTFLLVFASCLPCSLGFLPPSPHSNCGQSIFASSLSKPFHDRTQSYPATIIPTPTTTRITSILHLSLSPELVIGTLVGGFGLWLYIDGAGDRDRRKFREEEEARIRLIQEERAKRAYIEPKEYWTEAELAPYDGSQDEDGPILMAADGLVFNVYKGRNFYLPGCEYHIFAGRDATRLLAKNKLEEETEEEAKKPLNMADRAFLATWMYTFKGKYDIVGKLKDYDPKSTAM